MEPGLVDVFGNEHSPEEDERELEQWELDMMEKIERVEKRFADLDGTLPCALSASVWCPRLARSARLDPARLDCARLT